MNSGEGDLESVLTDGRRDSKAIEHLAAALRLMPYASATLAGGHLDQLLGPPTGPDSVRQATKRALKWPRLSLKAPPD